MVVNSEHKKLRGVMCRKRRKMKKSNIVMVLGMGVGLVASVANAALLDYEGFNYDTNKLAGLDGGTGWDSYWVVSTDTDLSNDDTSLSFSGVPTTGDRMLDSGGFGAIRNLESSFVMNAEGNVLYVSMLLNKGSTGYTYGESMQLQLANGSNARFNMGVGSDEKFFLSVGGSANVIGTKAASADTTYLMVAKVTSSLTMQTASMKIYGPEDAIDASEPVDWDITSTGYTGYNLYMLGINGASNLSGASIDEIRVADTWTDAIPEPTAAGLLGMGTLMALLLRCFRR